LLKNLGVFAPLREAFFFVAMPPYSASSINWLMN
jgi:hypothetical protein